MDNKALYNLSYGIFLLTTKMDSKANGCITNTCIQVANSPTRIAIAVLNTNYTCDLIKKSGVFAVSVLDETVTFETIKHWGFQSGRDVDKFHGITSLATDVNDVPYIPWHSCAIISGKVLECHELGTHTLFIAEVVEAKVLGENKPATYAFYQSNIKPKADAPKQEKKIKGFRCTICDYVYEGEELPADFICPVCGHPAEDFEPIYE